jgi:putative endonuclease
MNAAYRRAQRVERRRLRGRVAHVQGHRAEWVAALWLMLKGYRILGFRLRTPFGEVDLLARRGGVLAVVEVKLRPTLDEALAAVTPEQADRLAAAAKAVAARPALRGLRLRGDIVALAPGRLPRHRLGAWSSP